MWDTNGRKIKRFLVGLTWKRKKSWKKYQKAIERYILILKKELKEGETKWVYKTKQKALARLKKYGISMAMVVKAMESKGLESLTKLVEKE